MIRASVLYPNEPGKKFDFDYYINRHMVMVRQKLAPFGLIRCEVDKATDVTSPFLAVGHLYFNSLEDFQSGFFAHVDEFTMDMPNYTDIPPQMQISEIVK
jgi:uncharacterized protein (TIGR02118 family)